MNIIAEIGINYAFGKSMGEFVYNAQCLIDVAAISGCTHVKFQKRNPIKAVPNLQKNKEKIVPWRREPTTYLQYKMDIELSYQEIEYLFKYAKSKGVEPFASVWDEDSALGMYHYMDTVKIPSAKLTDSRLLEIAREYYPRKILSTGMSTEPEIQKAVILLSPDVLMHTNSTYPTPEIDLNMGYIKWLATEYPGIGIGYSNHYYGLTPMIAAAAFVDTIEFHICMDHEAWGSDQASSIEPNGVFKAVKAIKIVSEAFSTGYGPRELYPGEEKKREALRG